MVGSRLQQGDRVALRSIKRQQRRTLWEDARNVPNLLTFARIVMIPIVLVLLGRGSPRDCFWAAAVYSLAALTDMLDGWLARRQGLVSVLGKFLDPLADKLIVSGTLVWLVPMGRIGAWAVVLLISREITITALRSIASSEGIIIAAGDGGKTKTALQMIGIVCLILGYPYSFTIGIYDFGAVDLVHVGRLLVYLSLGFSLWSAGRYMSLFVDAIDAKNKLLHEAANREAGSTDAG
ncbi:CDP-diacylglycerol--glycerol-3-phosphate 3-phosphatidyltransferase [Polyangium aurulentum]|uniref:CDP-diacylglycerol--glycerol-3-phosphate 3-phosphatidyltransferase n=1 Tax=Polyangium aurulentum TaxID=2567896 RepID=UPI0010AECD43|nr:CDP-diacylglycerol--glycerol-3-phosphate 3-phosphatidyltransferase [Polyangium aurulentum]UQA58186.1 CDP-diacylglycerol--glycerol-3-phosphate 3-phosphatidyltransferase [Polyangium aurulentum]